MTLGSEIIVPFKCHKCRNEFQLQHGGACSVCNNIFCSSCLKHSKEGLIESICIDCSKKGDKKENSTPITG